MWGLFRDLAGRGTTLVISTHLMEEALLCDRVAVLQRGLLLADDPPARIMEAGRTRLTVQKGDQTGEKVIPSTPTALAEGLRPYGLDGEIDAVTVKPDTLEDVIVALIQSREES